MKHPHSLGLGWVAVGVGAIALISAILSVPVWQQNRYLDLMKIQEELRKERLGLESEIIRADFENRKLRSLFRLEPVANALGLAFHAVPVKVMEIPTAKAEADE